MCSVNELSTNKADFPRAEVGFTEAKKNPDEDIQRTNDALHKVQSALGKNRVFISIPYGKKGPISSNWQKTSIDAMTDPQYLEQFNHLSNIGVLLGAPSANLICIDIDNVDEAEKFLEANIGLQDTTRVVGSKGFKLFVEIEGDYPSNYKIKDESGNHIGDWLADGKQAVVYGRHPTGVDYTIVVNSLPQIISFTDIVWPESWISPKLDSTAETTLDDLITDRYGAPFYTNDKGSITSINEAYWAGLYDYENIVLYEPAEGAFYLYKAGNGLWIRVTDESIAQSISERLLETSRTPEYSKLERFRTQYKLKAIVNQLKGICEKRSPFDHQRRNIHVKNGMLEIKDDGQTIEIKPFDPDYYSRNQIPFDYNPDSRCDRFLNELVYPAMSKEDVELLQRFFGSAILQDNFAQRFLILEGKEGRGKSTLARIIQLLIGPDNIGQLRTEFLNQRFELYRLRAKTLLIGADVPGNFLMRKGSSALKAWVGGDPLEAEGKNKNESFPLKGRFNVLITCNERLRIWVQGDLGSWRRRILTIPFNAPSPEKRISNFAELLIETEGEGILAWAVAGAVKHLQEIKESGDYLLTLKQEQRIDNLLAESESLRHFLKNHVTRERGCDITKHELLEAYGEYCAHMGWIPFELNRFQRELPKLMLELFQVAPSHSIQRAKAEQGFRKVKLVNLNDES